MLDLLMAGGWTMPFIVAGSVIAMAIVIERLLALKPARIAPPHLLAGVWQQLKAGELDAHSSKTASSGFPSWRHPGGGACQSRSRP